jgi:hypothetical protein
MADLEKLRGDWERAEAKAIQIQNDKDEAIDKIRAKYGDKQRDAVNDAAAKQKTFLDAEAAQALVGRDDAEIIAEALGLTLPNE